MCATEYIALATGMVVFISEVLPFIESHKSNGILHFVYVCWNSDCLKEKVALKEPETEEQPHVEMVEVVLSSGDEAGDSDDETDDSDY